MYKDVPAELFFAASCCCGQKTPPRTTPAMTIRLRVVQGRPNGKNLSFDHGEFIFGRGEECHVRPNSEWVSRQHCVLRVTRDAAWIRDLASCSGTLVNGVRVTSEQALAQGDLVEVGPLVFEVDLDLPPCI